MGDDEIRLAEVKRLFDGSTPRRTRPQPPIQPRPQANSIVVNGDRNVVGDGVTIITTDTVVHRPIIVTQPGREHISVEQRAVVQRLVYQIVRLEAEVGTKPKTHRAVWGTLNSRMQVSSYKLLPVDRFGVAERYLKGWIARLERELKART